jgi:hypothetical protein
MRAGSATPMRALLVALLLAGLGLWQAWQCSDGMMASPMTPTTPVTTPMTATMSSMDLDATHAAAVHETDPGPGMPGGLAAACLSVLAGLAAAFMLIVSPLRLLTLVRRVWELAVSPVELPTAGPALYALCVSRT